MWEFDVDIVSIMSVWYIIIYMKWSVYIFLYVNNKKRIKREEEGWLK